MRKKTKTRKKFGRICALVLVGMFIVMTSMPISANDPDDWSKGGDSFSGTGEIQILGTLSSDSISIIAGGQQGIIIDGALNPGFVGIGLPSQAYPANRLDVAGGMAIGEDFAGTYSAPSDGMIIEGWVGIGTTNPRYPLEVVGDVWLNSDTIKMGVGTFYIKVQKDAKLSTDDYRIIIDENDNQNDRYFSVEKDEGKNDARGSGTELMRVQENGNVGIATQNPTQKLHVAGSVRIEEHIFDSNNDQGTDNYILRTTATGIDWVDPSSISDGDWTISGNDMYSAVSGNVGIGETSPSSKLEVNGDVELTNLYDNDATNFFDGGATASETVTGITSTGALQTTSILISESGLTTSVAGAGLTGGGGIPLAVGSGDGIQVNADSIEVKLDGSTLAKSASGLKVAAGGITGTELNSGVAGNGLTGGGGTALAVNAGNGIEIVTDNVEVKLDGSTLAKSASGLKVAAGGITGTELNSGVAGSGLTGGGGTALAVNAGNGIEIVTDNVEAKLDGSTLAKSASGLKVAAGGITGTELNSGVAGSGLTGGGGLPLAIGSGSGIKLYPDTIGVYGLMAADGDPAYALKVDNDGDVGIGETLNINYKLDVNGDIDTGGYVLWPSYTFDHQRLHTKAGHCWSSNSVILETDRIKFEKTSTVHQVKVTPKGIDIIASFSSSLSGTPDKGRVITDGNSYTYTLQDGEIGWFCWETDVGVCGHGMYLMHCTGSFTTIYCLGEFDQSG